MKRRGSGTVEAEPPDGQTAELPGATFKVVRQFHPSMCQDAIAVVLEDDEGYHWTAFNGEAFALLSGIVDRLDGQLEAMECLRDSAGKPGGDIAKGIAMIAETQLFEDARESVIGLMHPFQWAKDCHDVAAGKGLKLKGGEVQ
jgi:hypothetical protein